MANTDNLKKGNPETYFRSGREAVENGKKGGKASGKARRENRLIKEAILERMTDDDWESYIKGIIERAKGSKPDAEFLRDTIGQKPNDVREVIGRLEHQDELDRALDRLWGDE